MNKNLSFGWTILEWSIIQKDPLQSPFGPFRNRKQGIVSVPYQYRPNADHLPLAQNRPIPHCVGNVRAYSGIRDIFRIQHGLHTVPFSIYRAQCHDPSVFTQYELNDRCEKEYQSIIKRNTFFACTLDSERIPLNKLKQRHKWLDVTPYADSGRSYAERPFPSRAHLPSSGFICISQCVFYTLFPIPIFF